jgi:CHAP domain
MTLLDILSRNLGVSVKSVGGLGGECVDWANVYLTTISTDASIQSNAADWAKVEVKGFSWTLNNATNYPPSGSIVVWRPTPSQGIGVNGHIAVVLTADEMHLLTADQNWPEGAPVGVILHGYQGVIGWFRPV